MDNPTRSDVLDQAGIDPLLGQAGAAGVRKPGGAGLLRGDAAQKAARYDFRSPAFLSEPELRRLRVLHDEFARDVGGRLSLYLRMELGVAVAALTTVDYATCTSGVADPAHLALFKVDPLVGIGLLELSPALALTMADRLLGGRGLAAPTERHLTEIEVALVEDVLAVVLEEWCWAWKSAQTLQPAIIGHEHTGRFLQTAARDAVMLVVTLHCTLGERTEPLRLAVPYDMVEPLVRSQQARRQSEAQAAAPRRATWQAAFDGISVPVRAEWKAFEAPVREIAALAVGDVVELDPALVTQTTVLVNGVAKFVGVAGLDGDRVAVQLTRPLPNDSLLWQI